MPYAEATRTERVRTTENTQPQTAKSQEKPMRRAHPVQKITSEKIKVARSGHLGRDRMRGLIIPRFYWPGICKDVDDYVRHCLPCQKDAPSIKQRAPLHPIPVKAVRDQFKTTCNG